MNLVTVVKGPSSTPAPLQHLSSLHAKASNSRKLHGWCCTHSLSPALGLSAQTHKHRRSQHIKLKGRACWHASELEPRKCSTVWA
jgi:hypothetical protein